MTSGEGRDRRGEERARHRARGLARDDQHEVIVGDHVDWRAVAEPTDGGLPVGQHERGRKLYVLRLERAGFRTDEIGVRIEETRPARTPIVSRIVRSVRGLGTLWLALRRESKVGR